MIILSSVSYADLTGSIVGLTIRLGSVYVVTYLLVLFSSI